MVKNLDLWLMSYLKRTLKAKCGVGKSHSKPFKILFTICDHYEPYWNKVSSSDAYQRVSTWVDQYQRIASNHTDFLGGNPKHCFFYPEEEYKKDLLDMISGICKNGYGEVEIHLHHDNDTADNLRKTLIDFKKRLFNDHGLLSTQKNSTDIRYGFIHGNWALDNSRPDGRWCGVNNEIDVLLETGCYADFTMPSAPDVTQTNIVNSIYYAIGRPNQTKSHNTGILAQAGVTGRGLLCIQGPLAPNLRSRKYGILPRIENGCLAHDAPVTEDRVNLWVNQHIHVSQRSDVIFIKLHTHGTQEENMRYFFENNGLDDLFTNLESYCEHSANELYYVSSRQMYNVVKGLERKKNAEVNDILDSELVLSY